MYIYLFLNVVLNITGHIKGGKSSDIHFHITKPFVITVVWKLFISTERVPNKPEFYFCFSVFKQGI